MKPTPDQLRSVLSIDLGASYTKLAWRPAWRWRENAAYSHNRFNARSKPINLYPNQDEKGYLIPSLAYDPKDGTEWIFGKEAAGITPSATGCLHSNWKSTLFDERFSDESPEVISTIQIATNFLEWLKSRIEDEYDLSEANTRVCVPAFTQKKVGLRRLLKAFERAGWTDNSLLEVTEPKANLIGFASSGRNSVSADVTGGQKPTPNWRTMFGGENTPVLRNVRAQVLSGAAPAKWCIIDIGAFTTDIAICEIRTPIEVKEQKSYTHGLAKIDEQLKQMLNYKGMQISGTCHDELDRVKRLVYSGRTYTDVIQGRQVCIDAPELEEIKGWLTAFARDLLTMANGHFEGINGYILTGGPANISVISRVISEHFHKLGIREVSDQFRIGSFEHGGADGHNEQQNIEILKRIATALGGASVIIDFEDTEKVENDFRVPETPLLPGRECSCLGGNKNCIRCGGTGLRATEPEATPRTPIPLRGRRTSTQPQRAPGEVTPPKTQNKKSNPTRSGSLRQPMGADQEINPLSVEELIGTWKRSKKPALQHHSLDGWMGNLVFGNTICDQDARKHCLSNPSTPEGRAAWLRLLCLGCCLSARIERTTLKRFAEEELPDIWRALTPPSGKREQSKSYTEKLDSFFDKAIHKQFKNRNASWEDAELWRRVFYDFRKMHEFVYQNDLACSLLELVKEPRLDWNALAHFLKSGFLPGGKKAWRGVIGQSMTSPILFILRELRRLGIMDHRFDASCLYMNTAARRVAHGLGWITQREVMITDFDGLVDLSHKCHKRMQKETPELLQWFDLPLQIYRSKK